MRYEPLVFHTCVVMEKPHLLSGLWGSQVGAEFQFLSNWLTAYWWRAIKQVVFDIYVFVLTIWNAAERPRRVETELVTQLNRDGIFFFFVRLFLLWIYTRLCSDFLIMLQRTWLVFTLFSKLYLDLEKLEKFQQKNPLNFFADSSFLLLLLNSLDSPSNKTFPVLAFSTSFLKVVTFVTMQLFMSLSGSPQKYFSIWLVNGMSM